MVNCLMVITTEFLLMKLDITFLLPHGKLSSVITTEFLLMKLDTFVILTISPKVFLGS